MNDPHRPAYYVTTAIPYVNAEPHVGFAMELVLADVIARYRRRQGLDVRFCTGTDENSLKNVHAAAAAGVPTATLVERNAAAFRALREVLDLSFDDFIRTSADPRHIEGVTALWNACVDRGDVYRSHYRGLYCVGCEQFYTDAELVDGRCPEHGVAPDVVEEENDFFRLSRYQAELEDLLSSGRLRVVPEQYRNEALAFVRAGLEDFSISRSSRRAAGWGIEVPGDPSQVLYVWFDALGNYISALGFGGEAENYRRYWEQSDHRVHVIGKGITRFHAVYWPAILLSAGLPLPTEISVHGYLTVDGRKIGKSLGNAIDPTALAAAHGADTLRYFLCRHVRTGRDGDFSLEALRRAHDGELADLLGNLLQRTTAMVERYFEGLAPANTDPGPLAAEAPLAAERQRAAFDAHRLDDAIAAAWSLVELANRHVVERAPWKLAKDRADPAVEHRLAQTLYDLLETLRVLSVLLEPFVPSTAAEIRKQLGLDAELGRWDDEIRWGQTIPGTRVRPGPSLFPKTKPAPKDAGLLDAPSNVEDQPPQAQPIETSASTSTR